MNSYSVRSREKKKAQGQERAQVAQASKSTIHGSPPWCVHYLIPPLAVDYLLIVWEHRPRSNAKDLGWYPTPIISYCSGLEGDKPVGWDISGWSDQFGSGLVLLPVHNALPNK